MNLFGISFKVNKELLKICKIELELNKNAKLGVRSIVFLELISSSEGVKVDSAKSEAITKMLLLSSVNELKRLVGMIIYLGNFILNLAEVASPLRTLLKKEVKSKHDKLQLDAIGKLKLLVTTTPRLKIFNPNPKTRLKIDASSEGLGALLEQNHGALTYPKWYPVGYVSRPPRNHKKC